MTVSHVWRRLLTIAVSWMVLVLTIPTTGQAQKFVNFTTTGTIRSTLVFGNQIVPDVYVLFAEAGEFIRVETGNAVFGTTLRIVGPDAEYDLFDDDGGVGSNSLIRFTAPDTGAYLIIVSSYSGNPGGGVYDLTIARGSAAKQGAQAGSEAGQYQPDLSNSTEPKP